ncbi:MAG TPA: ABC transporter permease [Mariprofundaceae bacterium]|nr:ABC transporter permease [Mariprofundaceae bacterium]
MSAGGGNKGLSRMRLAGLMRKEFLQILRDPSSIAIAFVLPLVLLLLFGYGVSLDAKHVPIALVVEKPDAATASFTGAFRKLEYFAPQPYADMPAAEAAMLNGKVDAILHLKSDFGRDLYQPGGAPAQLIVNGVNANTARLVSGYVSGVWATWLQQYAATGAKPLGLPVAIEQRVWFNSELKSHNYLVPGLIAVIMTLIGALLTALVVSREWERGTMESLMATPVSIVEIMVGKLVPYFMLGTGGMLLSVAMAVWLFGVPLRGSLLLLIFVASLFLLVALGMGLLISTVAKNQFVASQIALIVTFLPAFLLSGFIFEIDSMPQVVQAITHIIPARYFVSLLHTIFMAGNVWAVIWPNTVALAVMALFFLAMVRRISRKRLD